jgi:hypothetical protein
VDSDSLKTLYASKTDGELLDLASDRRDLEHEARLLLFDELHRRELKLPGVLPRTTSSNEINPSSQNPAFNLPAKIAFAIFVVGWGSLAIEALIALVRSPTMPYMVLSTLVICGPIFGGIVWATRRALREIGTERRKRGGWRP